LFSISCLYLSDKTLPVKQRNLSYITSKGEKRTKYYVF
jgi:hypothetical protein